MKVLEVNKEDLKHNIELLKNKVNFPETNIIAVVKANGMGLDLVQYSKYLVENGINTLAVANVDEAVLLRKSGIEKMIMILSEVFDEEEIRELINNDIVLTIGNLEEKNKIEQIAISLNKKVQAQIKIDTGFARYRI